MLKSPPTQPHQGEPSPLSSTTTSCSAAVPPAVSWPPVSPSRPTSLSSSSRPAPTIPTSSCPARGPQAGQQHLALCLSPQAGICAAAPTLHRTSPWLSPGVRPSAAPPPSTAGSFPRHPRGLRSVGRVGQRRVEDAPIDISNMEKSNSPLVSTPYGRPLNWDRQRQTQQEDGYHN